MPFVGMASNRVDIVGTYSKHSTLLDTFADLRKYLDKAKQRTSDSAPIEQRTGLKAQPSDRDIAEIIAKYQAGASMVQLRTEHRMAKRTVAKILRDNGVPIRPPGGQRRHESR